MINYVQVLDCTLRDGGFALEDMAKSGHVVSQFAPSVINDIINHLRDSRIDIIEVGSIEISLEDKSGFAIYQNLESVSKLIPPTHSKEQMYVALYRGPDTPIEDIPEHTDLYCDGLRVILRYSELRKSLDFCASLSKKGYKVFIQPMLTMRYSDKELRMIADAANSMDAYALYFVDSYGYMQSTDVQRLFRYFDRCLKESVRIGFHAHNNMNLAFSNALTFVQQESERKLIVDSCTMGMGQGAGNLQTEIIISYLNERLNDKYDFNSILAICELIEAFSAQSLWGYSVTRMLPAIHKTAYKYALALRNQYGLSFTDINDILKCMPEEIRHRYTPENTVRILQMLSDKNV